MATPLIIFIIFIIFIISYKLIFSGGNKPNLPPSPPALPIIGNLLQLTSLPHRSFHALSQTYGPLMLVRIGQVPILIVSSPDTALEVLKTHDLAFANRPFSKPFFKLTNGGSNISFAQYGDYWRQTKKLAVVHLLNQKRVQSFQTIRQHQASLMIQKIAGSKEEEVVNVSEIVHEYSNEVVSRAAAGKLGNAKKIKEMAEEAAVLFGGFQVYDMFPAMGWLSVAMGLEGKLEKVTRKVDAFFSEIVEEHVERRRHGGAGEEKEEEDFVDLLLALKEEGGDGDFAITDADIKAIIMDMIGAGTDTSYVTLEWAMTELIKNPRTMKKAQDEVRKTSNGKPTVSENDIPQMSYLQAVIKEVLRLHPAAPLLLPHETRQKVVIQGYEIPERTRVLINAWSIGRDPNSWEDPEEFKPERFVGSSMDFKGLDFKFIPFGAGRRICPGINFAITSIEFALASLLYHFNWRLPDGISVEDLDMQEVPGLTTPRKQSLHLIATPYLQQVFV
ncbi:Premnaspirodiene oxygenase protein [Dioscorea alata]|uniref:Premnaspirodiene oxygenase protein n=1 Tax=Dioscorea alata TaxID=55571 RepID=A0ACB7WU90_DIOAL|nr:Premnaspirodiene oxygenase protein [Dioscorea alata]